MNHTIHEKSFIETFIALSQQEQNVLMCVPLFEKKHIVLMSHEDKFNS